MDDTWGLTKMTRLEVVIGGEDVPVVTDLLSEVADTGSTAVANVSGHSYCGHHQGRLVCNDRDALTLLTGVLPAERAGAVLAGLRLLPARGSGVLLVSDTWVSRPDCCQ